MQFLHHTDLHCRKSHIPHWTWRKALCFQYHKSPNPKLHAYITANSYLKFLHSIVDKKTLCSRIVHGGIDEHRVEIAARFNSDDHSFLQHTEQHSQRDTDKWRQYTQKTTKFVKQSQNPWSAREDGSQPPMQTQSFGAPWATSVRSHWLSYHEIGLQNSTFPLILGVQIR